MGSTQWKVTQMILVTASHVDARWRLDSVPFSVMAHGDGHQDYRVGGDDVNGFYAIAPNFGCGKTRKTPMEAIRHLLLDNGCTAIHREL